MMQKKETVEYVTRHFAELQGLRIIPFALYLVAGAVYDATWGYPHHMTIGMALLWLIAFGTLLAYRALGGYYRQQFGAVQPQVDEQKQRRFTALFAGFLVVNFALAAIDRATNQAYQTLILLLWWAALALVLLVLWASSGFRVGWPRRFSLWPILLLLVTGLWNFPGAPSQEACYPNGLNTCVALDLLLAGVIVAGGLYNHRLLVHALQPLPLETYE